MKKRFIIFIFCAVFSNFVFGQYQLFSHLDMGKSNSSQGFFLKNNTSFVYNYHNTKILVGTQFEIVNHNPTKNIFSGIYLSVSQLFKIKNFEFSLKGIYFSHLFSKLLHEHNGALGVLIERNHFTHLYGIHFRKYQITQKGKELINHSENGSMYELFNLIYLIKYNIMPKDHHWNIGISITNCDHFVINQATNPMFVLDGKYKMNKSITFYLESWVQRAGIMNISAHHYGFFIRTGVLWEIK